MQTIGALAWRLLKEANIARKEWKSKIGEEMASGSMGIETARQVMPGVNGLGGRSTDSPGREHPDRKRRGDVE